MANAKIISIVDHEVAAAMRLTAKDLAAARAQATKNLRFVADNLRHDINILADAINMLRRDVDAVISVVEGVRQDVEQLKQRGVSPVLND